MDNFYHLEEIKWILSQFEDKLSKYSVDEYIINDFEKVLLIEDSLALLISIYTDKDTCLGDKNGENENYGKTIYGLHIEEVSYNNIGFKYNHSEFKRFIQKQFNMKYVSHITYTKFKGYTRLYWCSEEQTAAEYVDEILPELNLRERYDNWCGVKYYFIIFELTDNNGIIRRGVAYTVQNPLNYVNNFCKEYINKHYISSEIRGSQELTSGLSTFKNVRFKKRLDGNLKYFYIENYFKEKDDVWRYADKLLAMANDGELDYIERTEYSRPSNRWVREEAIFKIVSKLYKNYAVIPQYRPSFLRSSFGGQMSYDIFISKLNIAIEHQGKQHFEPIDFFGGIDSFEKQKIRDEEKKKLSEEHGIKLIYINFNEDITEDLIREKINSISI